MVKVLGTGQRLVETVRQNGVLGGIALDVYAIIAERSGQTVGEIFLAYKAKYPQTTRSRNELAKRVSDLTNWGAIKASGTTVCPVSFREASVWAITGDLPNKTHKPSLSVIPKPSSITKVAPVAAEIVHTAPNPYHLATLRNLASRSKLLLKFRWLMPKAIVRQNEELLAAVEYAIERIA